MAQDSPPSQPTPAEEIDLLKERLRDAQKSAALGELLGTTTHEFNNVLMTMINYAKIGVRHKDEATRDKAFTKILAAGQRAAKITNTVLAMARNRSMDFEPTHLRQIIEESLLLLERELNKYRIHVETQFDPVPEVEANGNQIQQVLLNLLINARQAMPEGGKLVLRLAHDSEKEMVDLVVRDNGKGISSDLLPKIFDPYFTTKTGPDATGRGGTGLGLASCRDIIEAHRGRIRVESTLGKGTAFTIKLPAAKVAKPAITGANTVVLPQTLSAAPGDKTVS
jgi:signal transduction histidine kinase